MKVREGDVFSFRYKPEIEKKMFEPYHFFDGQLIAKTDTHGKIFLEDTFARYSSGSRTFTLEEAEKKGILKYRFNLNKVNKGTKSDLYYYSDKDVFVLNCQHGCYKEFHIRKGAKRSKEKMLQVVNQRIKGTKKKIKESSQELIRLGEIKSRIEMGDLETYYLG